MDNISNDNLINKNVFSSQQNEVTIDPSFEEKPKSEEFQNNTINPDFMAPSPASNTQNIYSPSPYPYNQNNPPSKYTYKQKKYLKVIHHIIQILHLKNIIIIQMV